MQPPKDQAVSIAVNSGIVDLFHTAITRTTGRKAGVLFIEGLVSSSGSNSYALLVFSTNKIHVPANDCRLAIKSCVLLVGHNKGKAFVASVNDKTFSYYYTLKGKL